MLMWAAMGTGLLLKGLIAAVFPVAAGLLYLALTRQLFVRQTWKRLRPFAGIAAAAGDRRAVACAGDAAQSAVFRFHDAQRERLVSRVLLVLFHQRACAAVSESAISARLQHGAAAVFLAVPPAVVLSVERVLSGGVEAELPEAGPGIANATAGVVLVRLHPGVLHVLDDAGILLDAVLSGAGAAVGLGDGERRRAGCDGARGSRRVIAALAAVGDRGDPVDGRGLPAPGDIASALTQNPDVYTLSLGHMTDLTLQAFAYLRLPLAVAGVAFVVGRGRARGEWKAVPAFAADDGAVLPRGAAGAGGVRSVSVVAAAGGGAAARRRRGS